MELFRGNRFILVDTPNELQEKVLREVSLVTKTTGRGQKRDRSTVYDLIEIINSETSDDGIGILPLIDDYLYKHYVDIRNINAVEEYKQIVVNFYNEKNYRMANYGIFLPSYLDELEKYDFDFTNQNHHQSLLVGCLTIKTAQAFISTVESVFPGSETKIIDAVNEGRLDELPNFQIMDALETSFEQNTFNTIQTNFLLSNLVDKKRDNRPKKEIVGDFFSEAYRILDKNGRLIMIEGNLDKIFDFDEIKILSNNPDFSDSSKGDLNSLLKQKDLCTTTEIELILLRCGFNRIRIGLANEFKHPQDLVRKMQASRGARIEVKQDEVETLIDFPTLVITADKVN